MFDKKQDFDINDLLEDTEDVLYEKEYFLWILKQEMIRFERSNQTFSVILLETSYFRDLLNTHTHISIHSLKKGIRHMLGNNFRKTDIKGWYSKNRFAVLMPNTPKSGAFIAYNKLRGLGNPGVLSTNP